MRARPMLPKLYIGTSGWDYNHWKSEFYAGVKRKDWLRFYAEHFTAVEVNATFYRLQDVNTFMRWREKTPDHFRFVLKGNRYLTHNKRLIDPQASIRQERAHAQALGKKLSAVLWQLPANFHKHIERLQGFTNALQQWKSTRHIIEFRHPSWFDADVAECLQQNSIALCQSDAADWPMWDAITTDLIYIRLHGHTRTYASSYRSTSLRQWAQRIRSWRKQACQVHVYFDNDAEGAAPRNAIQLIELTNT